MEYRTHLTFPGSSTKGHRPRVGTGTKFVDVTELSDNGTKVLQNTHRNIENSIRFLHSKFNIKLKINYKRVKKHTEVTR